VRAYGALRQVWIFFKLLFKEPRLMNQTIRVFPAVNVFDVCRSVAVAEQVAGGITGRHCGDLGDKISQYCSVVNVGRTTGNQELRMLEIGTLFGGSCLMKLHAVMHMKRRGCVICIDPMKGFYGASVDPISGMAIDRNTFYKNLAQFGFGGELVDLRTVMSATPEAHRELLPGTLSTLMIDGDHSYEGVMRDWSDYSKYVAPQGMVLFDDYGDDAWPTVTGAVDAILRTIDDKWILRGTLGTTLIVERTRPR
jgi:hypothetical protein